MCVYLCDSLSLVIANDLS